MKRFLVAATLAACSCQGGASTPACALPFVGDPGQPPEATLVVTDGISGTFVDVQAGAAVPLERPPQGGYVLYAGARVRNVDPCGLVFKGQLVDGTTVLAADTRRASVLTQSDGSAAPDPSNTSNFANVAACPDFQTKDVHGQGYRLEVQVVDRGGRTATAQAEVVPTCSFSNPDTQALCVCVCSQDFSIGKCNGAGPPDGG